MSHQKTYCPICGNELTIILYGLIPEGATSDLDEKGVKYTLGGCSLLREKYHCDACETGFTGDLEPLKWCILTSEDQITENECRDYAFLETRKDYRDLSNRDFICGKICPLMDKRLIVIMKDKSVYRGQILSVEDDRMELYKGNPYTYTPTIILYSETESITEDRTEYEYTSLADGSAEIRKYYGKGKVLEIPGNLDGKTVTALGRYAFSKHKMTSVTIPGSVKVIGNSAFSKCDKLTSITIPEGVSEIGEDAFSECESLISVIIPGGVTKIGDHAFCGCKNLTSVNIPDSAEDPGENLFDKCDRLTDVRISPDHPTLAVENDTIISKADHRLLRALTGFTSHCRIPESVRMIERNAFIHCHDLTSIEIPSSVRIIEEDVFPECLETVKIPAGVFAIGQEAFHSSDRLTAFVFRGSHAEQYCRENHIRYIFVDD